MLLCPPPNKGLIVLVKIMEVIRIKVEVEFLVQVVFFLCVFFPPSIVLFALPALQRIIARTAET